MRINTKLLLVIALLLLGRPGQLSAFEKVGTTSFQFLKVYPGARASAMSGAFSSIAVNSDAVFWNPAGITRVANFDASVNYIGWLVDTKHYALSAAYNLGDIGTIGVQGIMTDAGEIEETKVEMIGIGPLVNGMYNPGLTGAVFKPSSMVIGLTFARQLTDRFSV
jgi:hypothetical protein